MYQLTAEDFELVKKMTARYRDEDLTQQCYLALFHAADKYDPRKNDNFPTYATIWIKKYRQKYWQDQNARSVEVNIDDCRNIPAPETESFSGIRSVLRSVLDGRSVTVVLARLGGKQYREIAPLIGIKKERARQIYSEALRTLRRRMKT